MQLSEETQNAIRAVTHDDAQHTAVEAIVVAAVERARVVAPLVWDFAQYLLTWRSGSYRVIHVHENQYRACVVNGGMNDWIGQCMSADEAKAACQAHHAAYVLSMLVAV